ncbi:hypothetical protein IFM89_020972 [Coptis chinensis]|uniref:Uncharacterized protein n=1 Tax=Coptis chinensis TaxID=261450 RepID=A0A835M0X9_9MAGN|nr:hypothetical protein IFM89_020972 [Coptis chinensis]
MVWNFVNNPQVTQLLYSQGLAIRTVMEENDWDYTQLNSQMHNPISFMETNNLTHTPGFEYQQNYALSSEQAYGMQQMEIGSASLGSTSNPIYPEQPKSEIFNSLICKVNNRISGWKSKVLSQAARTGGIPCQQNKDLLRMPESRFETDRLNAIALSGLSGKSHMAC